jgi:hypothetical protein
MIAKQLTTILVLTGLVTAGIAAIKPSGGDFKNLQILPKDISVEKLDSIMGSYNKALGVGCDFCHTAGKENLDFADDKLPMKTEARKMMRMTIELNKTYFYYDSTKRPEYLNVVHCMMCHRGEAYPAH